MEVVVPGAPGLVVVRRESADGSRLSQWAGGKDLDIDLFENSRAMEAINVTRLSDIGGEEARAPLRMEGS